MGLREALKGKIPQDKLNLVPSSYDIIGSREKAVAVVEIPEEVKDFEAEIANAIMQIHRNVKSVLEKSSERFGDFRLRRLRLILGEKDTEVLHKEHGYLLKLDPAKVYFSPREATERQRIASQVKPNEFVMVFFGGVAPYAIAIAKKQPQVKRVVSIELNPDAHSYALENVKLNKVSNKVFPVLGDVKEKFKDFVGKCDRVVMPLPKGAYKFLNEAFQCLKETGYVHFYHWAPEENLYGKAVELLKKHAEKYGKRVEIIAKRKVLPYAPRIWKVCIDCKVE